jgi:hypothetical protein
MVYADYVYPRSAEPLRIADLATKEDEIIVASIRRGWRADGQPGYHAIVITDVDTEHNMVSYSDPNFPNSRNRVKAFEAYDRNGNVTVMLMAPASPGADAFEGMINDMLRIRVTKR